MSAATNGRPAGGEAPFPLNDIQGAYWAGRRAGLGLPRVSPRFYAEIEIEDIDLDRMNRALRRLIERHDMIRAVFDESGRQRVLAAVPAFEVETEDLRDLPVEDRESRLRASRDEMLGRELHAGEWMPFQFRALALDHTRSRLQVVIDLMIMDAASLMIFSSELETLYATPEAALEPLDFSFREYLLRASELERDDSYREARDYWLEQLDQLPAAPELPLARAPGSLDRVRFSSYRADLPADAWQSLQRRSTEARLTSSAVLTTAYAETLATWSRSPRFALNLTVHRRAPLHPQVERIIGQCTSVTLLPYDASGRDSLTARAERTQSRLFQDLRHYRFSGLRVVRELARREGLGRAVMPIVFTNIAARGRGRGGFEFLSRLGRPIDAVMQTPQVWLEHELLERDEGLALQWNAVDDLFPDGLIADMLESYRDLLERLARDDTAWTDVPRRLPARQLECRASVNDTSEPIPPDLLTTGFHEHAATHPHTAAVAAHDRTLTYSELAERSGRLASVLREAGARPERLVGVLTPKGWQHVVALLAVLDAGAAYLPLDIGLPAERLEYMITHCEVEIVLTQRGVLENVQVPPQVRTIEVDGPEAEGGSATQLVRVARPESLAYTIFTSGSTGRPKGVMIEHRAIMSTIVDLNRRFALTPRDKVLGLSSLSFDLSVYDIFATLTAGATIVMLDPAAQRDPARWAALVERQRVTVWNSVPAFMRLLVDYAAGREDIDLGSLRLVMLSGDWIPVALPGQVRELMPGVDVWSLAGATEASIWSYVYPIGEVDPAWESIPFGTPMLNQTATVLDEELDPRPDWVPGQLFIGGDALARGYWREEEKTAAAFFMHPRSRERLYRTGDVARYLPSGDIEFLGREDNQVKIQGFRIELGEVEVALERHPDLATAVATAIGPRTGDRRLVAYYVAAPDRNPDAAELQSFLRDRLPSYMVPSNLVQLESIPLNSNGKVNRAALPAPERAARSAPRAGTNGSPADGRMAAIVSLVLGVDSVDENADLADLGLSSVDLIRTIDEVERTLGVRLDVDDAFHCSRVADLAGLLDRASGAPSENGSLNGARPQAARRTAGASFVVGQARDRARLRLVCFPHGGGGPQTFRGWDRELPDDIELWAVQLPGHGARLRETPLETIDGMVDSIYETAARRLDGPFAFFGHSLGALLSFEIARRFRHDGRPGPQHLFVASAAAPHLPLRWTPVADGLSDSELLEVVREHGGLPDTILSASERTLALLLPALRADLLAFERYSYRDDAPLDCPLTAFGGRDDALVSEEQLRGWEAQTRAQFALDLFDGDHFFINGSGPAVVRAVSEQLGSSLVKS
ncbi:MAG: non-ribosomal peptide synthetase [Gaiellaceae bacterium]